MDLPTLFVILAASFVAVVSQLLTGFGFALVLIPLLMLVIGPAEAVVVATILGSVLTSALWLHDRPHVDVPRARRLIWSSLVGLPVGVGVLTVLPPTILRLIIIVVIAAALVVVTVRVSIGNSRWTNIAAGFTSGVMLTSTGVNGPPLIVSMRASHYTVRQYRATLAAVFCFQGWAGVAMLAAAGKVSLQLLILAGAGLIAMPAAFFVGERLFRHVDAGRLKIGIILMLLLCMVVVVFR